MSAFAAAGLLFIAGLIWLGIDLLRERLRQRRWHREDRAEARLLVMHERVAQNNGHPRTGNVEPHGYIPRD